MAALVLALTLAGSHDEAMAVGRGLIDAAEATRNPWALSFALFTYGFAFSDADSVRALDALRRGLVIAQDSGNRANESFLAVPLARAEAKFGDPLPHSSTPRSRSATTTTQAMTPLFVCP